MTSFGSVARASRSYSVTRPIRRQDMPVGGCVNWVTLGLALRHFIRLSDQVQGGLEAVSDWMSPSLIHVKFISTSDSLQAANSAVLLSARGERGQKLVPRVTPFCI